MFDRVEIREYGGHPWSMLRPQCVSREPLLRSDRFMDSRAILLEFLTRYSGRRPSWSASRYDQVEYPPQR